MADEKENKIEKEKPKKLEEFKNNALLSVPQKSGGKENKKAIEAAEGKVESEKETKKEESKPAVAKVEKKSSNKEAKVELEREYIVPLKKGVLNVPRYRRAKKAIRVLKEFLAKHMKVEGRDLKKVKIDLYLNNEIWFRGIKKPMNKVKVRAVKRGGIVYAELAELPEAVKYVKTRADKRSAAANSAKVKTPKHAKPSKEESEAEGAVEDKDKDGVVDKVEEKEDRKAGAEKDAKMEKAAAKSQQHTTKSSHAKKTMPIRKTLKR